MQDSNIWAPPAGVLGELVRAAEARVRALESRKSEILAAADAAPPAPSFRDALDLDTVAVIAEVKKASPSKGPISPDLDVSAQAAAYERGGAAAISVLTEPSRFGGDLSDLLRARAGAALPLLRKDFIVDEIQLAEARGSGASAALLIVRALDPAKLKELYKAAVRHRLYALVEVRDEAELEIALSIGAAIIGVNNRNLETLEMDDAAFSLIGHIPRKCVAVAESGLRAREDVERAAKAGADAVLIGSELSRSSDPAKMLAGLATVNRSRNARPN